MKKRYGVMCTPKPIKLIGVWMNDGGQDGDRWVGTKEDAKKEVRRARKLDSTRTYKVEKITDEDT